MIAVSGIDPAVAAAIARFGRSALAWEVLRRDPAYRLAFRKLIRSPQSLQQADPTFVARWGVHFP
jgi:hypothetical protein